MPPATRRARCTARCFAFPRLGPRKADGIWTNSIVLVQPHGVTGGTGSLWANPKAGTLIADVPCSRWAASPRGALAPILRTAVLWSFLFLFPAVAWKHLSFFIFYFLIYGTLSDGMHLLLTTDLLVQIAVDDKAAGVLSHPLRVLFSCRALCFNRQKAGPALAAPP